MRLALAEAEQALARREVPVGCVFVSQTPLDASLGATAAANGGSSGWHVLAGAGNETNEMGNATRHAEMVAMDKIHALAARHCPGRSLAQVLAGCTLYVTCEPCIMCAAALSEAKVRTVVFGCCNDKFGGCGSVVSVDPAMHVTKGVFEVEAVEVFRRFYERDNPLSRAAPESA